MADPGTSTNRSSSADTLGYFVLLALRSFRRDRLLTISIMLTLAVGIAASMTVFSILHVLAGDPIPEKSDRLFKPTFSGGGLTNDNRPHLFSLPDAQAMIRQLWPPERGTILAQGFAATISTPDGRRNQGPSVLFTSAPFFTLFDVPFLQGGPWNAAADATGDHVAVLSRPLARELFGATLALGKTVTLGGLSVRVVGVTDNWHPIPRFYDLSPGAYTSSDNINIPLKSIRDMNSQVFVSWGCPDASAGKQIQGGHFAPLLGPGCGWVSVWAEISSPQGRRRLAAFLAKSLVQLKKEGHASPSASSSLPDVLQTLQRAHVVPGDIRAYTVMGFLFLWLCVLSATGTLLGKFLRRSPEIGVRRALGASRTDILLQFLIESGLLGAGGGVLGVLLAQLSLTAIRHAPTYLSQVVGMSATLLVASVSLAVICGVLAGLMPAWRAARTDIGIVLRVS